MRSLSQTRWLRLLAVLVLCACSDAGSSANVADAVSPQLDYGDDDDERGRSADPRPDIRFLAKMDAGHARPAAVAAQWIGPGGGSVRVGDFEIVVPAGAVSRATKFSIRLPADPTGADYAYAHFEATGAFSRVTIRLPRVHTDADSGARVLWWDGSRGKWYVQPTTQRADGRIEAQVDHFSIYGTEWTGWFKGVTPMGG